MKKLYDPTTRKLIELGPAAWARFLRVSMTDPGRQRGENVARTMLAVQDSQSIANDEKALHGRAWSAMPFFLSSFFSPAFGGRPRQPLGDKIKG
jgi:hypothetical protein